MSRNEQLEIAQFNDRWVGNNMLTMQQAHDLASHILANPNHTLAQSLPVQQFKESSEVEAATIRRSHGIPDANEVTGETTSTSDSLMDRSFCISAYRNETADAIANKDFAKELLKFIGNTNQSKISFALCSAPTVVSHGTHQSIEGATHWTALHARKILNTNGTYRVEFFYANSTGASEIPAGIRMAIQSLNQAIRNISNFGEAQNFLTSNNYIELEGGTINDTNALIINGLTMLGGVNYELPERATQIGCALQMDNRAGFGNTCCENALFNMFAMHYSDEFIASRTLNTSTNEVHHDTWNQFITDGRPTLQEIINQRTGGMAPMPNPIAPPPLIDDSSEISKKLSLIDNQAPKNLGELINKIDQLQTLRGEVVRSLSKIDSTNQKYHQILNFINQSLSINVRTLTGCVKEDSVAQAFQIFEQYQNSSSIDEQDQLIKGLINLCPEPQKTTAPTPPKKSTSPKKPTRKLAIQELNAVENQVISKYVTSRSPVEDTKTFAQEIQTFQEKEGDLEQFLRPRTYSGIGASTHHKYNTEKKQFEFEVKEVFPGGLAQSWGLKPGFKIIYKSKDNSTESLKEAVSQIRQLATLTFEGPKTTEEKNLIIKLKDSLKITNKQDEETDLVDSIFQTTPTVKNILIHEKQTFNDPEKFVEQIQKTKERLPKIAPPIQPPAPPKPQPKTPGAAKTKLIISENQV